MERCLSRRCSGRISMARKYVDGSKENCSGHDSGSNPMKIFVTGVPAAKRISRDEYNWESETKRMESGC